MVLDAKLASPSSSIWVVETRGDDGGNGQQTEANYVGWRDGGTISPGTTTAGTGTGPAVNYRTMGSGGCCGSYEVAERHLDTTNVLFADGHVKALKLDALAQTNSDIINGSAKNVQYLWTATGS